MSKFKIIADNYEYFVRQNIMYEIASQPGVRLIDVKDIINRRYGYDKKFIETTISHLVSEKFLEYDDYDYLDNPEETDDISHYRLFINRHLPDKLNVTLEGLRLTPKSSININIKDIWRIDSLHNLVEIGDDPVGNISTIIPKDAWYEAYHIGQYTGICSLCCLNTVRHKFFEVYSVCSDCYFYIKNKPELQKEEDIIDQIKNMRVLDDEIIDRDVLLFGAIQNIISDADVNELEIDDFEEHLKHGNGRKT